MITTETTTTTSIDTLANRRVLILGLARQGLAMARYCAAVGARVVVSDLRPADQLQDELQQLAGLNVETVLGAHPLSLLDRCDLISVSGSVPLDSSFVQEARARKLPLTNDSREFIRRCRAKTTMGITGSAGKTTTTSLVGDMGKLSGRTTWVGGNIGRPLLPEVNHIGETDLVIQELSSFQLDLWDSSPHIAGVLNITPNHLDRHKTMAQYTAAKANILRFQIKGDVAVLSADDPGAAGLAPLAAGSVVWFGVDHSVDRGTAVRNNRVVWRDGQREVSILPFDQIPLPGHHNLLNVLAAAALASAAGIEAAVQGEAIRRFKGVPHRLEAVREINRVRFINDSIATAPERALAALASFSEPLVLLAGGRDKKMVWDDWAKIVAERVDVIILFGALSAALREKLAAAGRTARVYKAEDLAGAVTLAHDKAHPGSIVLLSPGGTSYDSYKDFETRGQHFRDLVLDL
ncbi:MAG: UDP-N-acetylmuramoyl-L-alanine--D-glutamate ligase [Ardenticatenaceae bacterium]|nr:UDP-N-acetylmuramoyl-L-alanine--D-glutamate ligase [Ardenticatenaceae bacterium]